MNFTQEDLDNWEKYEENRIKLCVGSVAAKEELLKTMEPAVQTANVINVMVKANIQDKL